MGFPPLPSSQVSVSELVSHLKFSVLLPVSLQLLLLKLFADVIFQGSNIRTAVLSLSAYFQNNLYIQSISLTLSFKDASHISAKGKRRNISFSFFKNFSYFFYNAAVGNKEIAMQSCRVVYNQCLLAPKAAWLSYL